MKRILMLLAALFTLSLVGCHSSSDDDLDEVLTNGTWFVDYFSKDGDDDTSEFRNYVFTFRPDGTLTVTHLETTVTGTWEAHDRDTRLGIALGLGRPLERLNEDWVVDSFDDEEVLAHKIKEVGTQLTLQRF